LRYAVLIMFAKACSRKIEDFTRRNVGRQVALLVYGKLLCAPTIMEPLTGASLAFGVGPEKSKAVALAARINGREPPADEEE
jgi:preprotein translocase subunit SecD